LNTKSFKDHISQTKSDMWVQQCTKIKIKQL